MLFGSRTFLIDFLPAVVAVFLILSALNRIRLAGIWLTLSSLIFYTWWRPDNLPILLTSIVANYLLGGMLMKRPSRVLLAAGIAGNVAVLAVFKYTGFVAGSLNDLLDARMAIPAIVLPLGISFFTFQQIAYLVDAADGDVVEHDFWNYCLFITFFPHLIAGPITHHREMLSQFGRNDSFRPTRGLFATGLTLFLIGLFKKVMIADPFGASANPVFSAAAGGGIRLIESWTGALSYALQLYFDFSGYSDMAIGLGLLFGVALPINFDSPYKARNIIDFWARWHMTLTRFLTAYIYNPIVVRLTRRRMRRRLPLPKAGRITIGAFVALVAMPTMLTLLVSGLWHGAGWQFVIFGLLHGSYLVVAHGWRSWKLRRGLPLEDDRPGWIAASVLLTFLCVVIAQVFFRAPDVPTAIAMLRGMSGLNGITLPQAASHLPGVAAAAAHLGIGLGGLELVDALTVARIAIVLAAVWALPNAYQWLRDVPTALGFHARPHWMQTRTIPLARWRPSIASGLVIGAGSVMTVLFAVSDAPTEFLYFQF